MPNRVEKGANAEWLFQEELLWLDDAQSLYLSEVSFVECGYLIGALQSGGGDNQVVRTNHFAGGLQRRPDSGMFIRCLLRIGNNRQGLQKGVQVTLPRDLVRSGCPFHSVPEFGNRNCRDLKSIVGTGRHPILDVESALPAPNHHVRAENYLHLSP